MPESEQQKPESKSSASQSNSGAQEWWWRTTSLAAGIAIAIAVLFLAYLLARPIAILLASIIIAVALAPMVQYLERWLSRSLATVTAYVSVGLVILGLFTIVGAVSANELNALIDEAPQNQQELEDLVNRYDPLGDGRLLDFLRNQRGQFGNVAVQIPLTVGSTIANIVVAYFLSLYWVIFSPGIRRFFISLLGNERQRDQADRVIANVGRTMGGYVRGIVLDGTILAIVTYIGLSLIDVRFPLMLALLSGLSVAVPIIGPIAAATPGILLALIDSPVKAGIVLAFYIITQQIESNVLLPKLIQRQANIPPLLGVFAVFAGGSVGGILGALISVPLAGGILVIVTEVIGPAIRNRHTSE